MLDSRKRKLPAAWSASLVIAITFVAATGVAKGPSLERATEWLKRGKYAEAEAALARLRHKGARARLALARLQFTTGRYSDALKTARSAARGSTRALALTLRGEILRTVGDLATARKTLEAAVKRYPKHLRAQLILGLVYREQGKRALAKSVFDRFYDAYGNDTLDKSSAEQLTYVGVACRHTDNFRDASDVFDDATKADPTHVEAWAEWAEISLEKYQAGYAEAHHTRALKVNPRYPRSLVGLARVELVRSNDVRAASKWLDRALDVNPNHLPALVTQAQILIDNEQNAEGEKLLARALSINRNHLGALAMLGASHFLRDDLAGYKRVKQRVLGLNPHHTEFFQTVVALAVRHHRYREAIALGKEATKINPQDWYSLADLGTNYLRLGDDDEGLKYLKQAWRGDRYNVRSYNLLNLFDDVLSKQFTYVTTRHFKLRVHKSEVKLVPRIVGPLLERAYATYVRKYKFRPRHPIIIEFYKEPKNYAVRTVGLPGLSALGVCFGPMITTTSPTLGRFNWGQVLWHELNHVFTIQLSRSRVPRWLTEGLADREPTLYRPEWKRENDFDIYKALRSGKLHGLASMNSAFTRARNIFEMVVAYYQSSLMASYLVKHWGLPKVIRALKRYGAGERTEKILPRMTGLKLKDLDQRFRTAELARLSRYNKSFFVDLGRYRKLPRFEAAAKKSPGNADALADLAAAQLVARKGKLANTTAQRALKIAPRHKRALFIATHAALGARDAKRAKALAERLIAAGGDGYFARETLGRLALKRRDLAQGRKQLARAKGFDPDRSEPYEMLIAAYRRVKNTDAMIDELKHVVMIKQQNFAPIAGLVALLADKKDHVAVRRYGQLAYYIQPASVSLHEHLATAYEAPAPIPNIKRAIWHLETALLCDAKPKQQRELHKNLARLYRKLGKLTKAKHHDTKASQAPPSGG